MKKKLSGIISAVICSALIKGAVCSVSAENITVTPKYQMNNTYGELTIVSTLDKDVSFSIAMTSPEGSYRIYDTIIPAYSGKENNDRYIFSLEGNNDYAYTMTIEVPKSQNTDSSYIYTKDFTVKDVDFVTDQVISKYLYSFTLEKDNTLAEPMLSITKQGNKDGNNVVETAYDIAFPAPEIVSGDVNHDDKVDMNDLVAMAKHLMGGITLSSDQLMSADYNCDGKVNINDAIALAQKLMG